jgi:hypothetical protein
MKVLRVFRRDHSAVAPNLEMDVTFPAKSLDDFNMSWRPDMQIKRSNVTSNGYAARHAMTTARERFTLLAAVLLSALGAPQLYAQTITATVTGAVADPTGAVLPGATVTIVDTATGVKRDTVTNKEGLYAVTQLPPDTYRVSVSRAGFTTVVEPKVVLQINQTADLNFVLRVGSATVTVEVNEQGPLLETESVSLGAVIDEKEVNDLPLNGRQFSQLIQLAPGVIPLSVGQTLSPSIGTGVISPGIDGQSNRANLVFIDGVLATDNLFSSYTVSPSIDAIASFQVQSHASDAQFGESTGGTINVLTKSGTNHIHGTAYEFFRNQDLQSDFYNVPSRTPFRINDYGGTIGFPVIKNKLFLFGFYEGVRQTIPVPEYSTIPTAQELTGDFSDSAIPIYDPATFDPSTYQAQQFDFNGQLNTIDPSRLNQGALVVLKAFLPAGGPNFSTPSGPYDIYNYKYIGSDNFTQSQYGIRGDYSITPRDLFYTRVLVNFGVSNAPGQLPGNGYVNNYTDKNVSMNYVRILSPTKTLQVTGGLNYFDYPQYAVQNNAQDIFNEAGFAAGFTSTPGGIGAPYIPQILVYGGTAGGGFNIGAGWGGKGQNQQTLEEISTTFSAQARSHALRFGGVFYWTNEAGNYASNAEYFFPQSTGNAFVALSGNSSASLLLGLPIIGARQLGNSLQVINDRVMGIFAEDAWKVSPKLSINYGVRWDFNSDPKEAKNGYSYFDFRKNTWFISPGNPATPSGTLPDGVAIASKNTINSAQYTDFSPRLGVSYAVRPDTVVRAGAGAFYDNWAGILQAAQSSRGQWPDGAVQEPLTGLINYYEITPGATLQNPFGPAEPPVIPASPFPSTGDFWDPDFKVAVSWQYNLELQQATGRDSFLSLAYVGSSTARAPITIPINAPASPLTTTVPFPQMGAFTETESAGHIKYNALQSKYVQHLNSGLTAIAAFTWSKSTDVGCSDIFVSCQIQSPYDLRLDEGRSVIDVPIVFSVAGVYELPFGKGKSHLKSGIASHIFGNYQISSIFIKRSGSTVNPTFNSNATGGITSRPDVIGDPNGGPRTRSSYFNRAAFAFPARPSGPTGAYAAGDAGRNSLRGPGFVNEDFTLARNFLLPKNSTIQFRLDTFNVFNHPNFYNPDGNISNADFGELIGVGGNPREIQLSVKYIF